MKKVALLSMLFAALATQGINAKELKVGTNATYAPFEFVNSQTGEIIGFEIDLVKAMGKIAGYEIKLVNMDFDGVIPSLD